MEGRFDDLHRIEAIPRRRRRTVEGEADDGEAAIDCSIQTVAHLPRQAVDHPRGLGCRHGHHDAVAAPLRPVGEVDLDPGAELADPLRPAAGLRRVLQRLHEALGEH